MDLFANSIETPILFGQDYWTNKWYNGFIQPTGIDIDGMNNIVMSGFFIGDLDFDPGSGVQKFSSNPYDCYILKLDRQAILYG